MILPSDVEDPFSYSSVPFQIYKFFAIALHALRPPKTDEEADGEDEEDPTKASPAAPHQRRLSADYISGTTIAAQSVDGGSRSVAIEEATLMKRRSVFGPAFSEDRLITVGGGPSAGAVSDGTVSDDFDADGGGLFINPAGGPSTESVASLSLGMYAGAGPLGGAAGGGSGSGSQSMSRRQSLRDGSGSQSMSMNSNSSQSMRRAAASSTLSKMLREERSRYTDEKNRQSRNEKFAAARARRESTAGKNR